MVQSLILNNNGNREDAKDIFQEAIIVLYEKSKSDSFQLSCLIKTYVYSVSRRLWLKRLMQMQRLTSETIDVYELVVVEADLKVHEQKNADFLLREKEMMNWGEP